MGIVSVGYQGRDLEPFIADLGERGVTVLADVRLNAVSRRRGFSKRQLGESLAGAGIEYLHYRCLGNPKDNRAPFHDGRLEDGRRTFLSLMDPPEQQEALDGLARRAERHTVAVMCFEADHARCHRRVVIELLLSRTRVPVILA